MHADEADEKTRGRKPGSGGIPIFSLYGEEKRVAGAEFVHIEDIRSRSQRYNWTIEAHKHQGLFQLILLTSGGGRLMLDGEDRALTVPCAIVIPPAVVHSFRFLDGTEGYVLTITEAMLMRGANSRHRALTGSLFSGASVLDFASAPQRAARLAALLEQIMAERRELVPGSALMMEWLVAAVLLLAARQSELSEAVAASPRAGLFQEFRALVEEHFAGHWPLSRYAEALHVTESRLNRVCREMAGTSAFEVTQMRLLLEARRKLIYIAAPVSRIAYELGFDDPAYFSRFFKKRSGLTPAAFRRREHGQLQGAQGGENPPDKENVAASPG